MADHDGNAVIRMGTSRNFGLVIGAVFAIIAIWPVIWGDAPRMFWGAAALVIAGLGVFKPTLLDLPNRIWFRFGLLLGAVVAPIVMFLVYISTFLPIGMALRVFGKDLLQLKPNPSAESYWVERIEKPQSMAKQF